MSAVDRRLHIAADCSSDGSDRFDLATFLERLLLFERYTIRTHLCHEVDALVEHLGIVPTMHLVEAGVVRIHDGAASIGSFPTPHLQYNLNFVTRTEGDPERQTTYTQEHIAALRLPGASNKAARRLRSLLAEQVITTAPSKIGNLAETVDDINDRRDLLKAAVAAQLAQSGFGETESFHVEAKATSSDSITVATDLGDRLSIADEELHKMIGAALLAIAHVNQELSFMADLDAVGVVGDEHGAIVEKKVTAVSASAGGASEQLTRILQIAGLPDLGTAHRSGTLNLRKFLDARRSDEATEFRVWLRSANVLSEQDLKKMLNPLRIKAQSWQFKAFMILVGTIVPGFFGPAEALAGASLSTAQTFILDKLLAAPGPALFLRRKLGKALRP